MGKQNNIVKFGVPVFLDVPVFRAALGCSGVLWIVPECSRVLWCSGVPVFLGSCVPVFQILVHAILLTIFDNAWQNPVKWLLRARQIRSTSDANMEHAGEENNTWVFRFRVAQVCSLSFQIKFGNALQNPVNWKITWHRNEVDIDCHIYISTRPDQTLFSLQVRDWC